MVGQSLGHYEILELLGLLVSERKTTVLMVTHDPHASANPKLINFDTSIVFPNQNGQLRFVDQGEQTGSCDLLCHGENHDNFDY